jgi:DNA-binding CsgD family transcriptional regulator
MENTIRISFREKQVLRMLLNEKKANEIAKEIGIDEKTVCIY